MIALVTLMCLLGLLAGYAMAHLALDLNQQRVMNTWRREIGLQTKPYRLRGR